MFKRLQNAIIFSVAVLVFIFPAALSAKELPLMADLSKLRLKIIETTTVEKLPGYMQSMAATPDEESESSSYYRAPEGKKIVVVTLKGSIPSPCRLTYDSAEFVALYDQSVTSSTGVKKIRTVSSHAAGVTTTDSWQISTEGVSTNSIEVYAASPLILRIAFYLPKEVESFDLRYPTAIAKKATISNRGK
ncbi:MAG: hypothetical protein HXX17_01975 [Geobacteraceae bacterium]|nr:hypothetical protein [Geobacteraceae bacterium]